MQDLINSVSISLILLSVSSVSSMVQFFSAEFLFNIASLDPRQVGGRITLRVAGFGILNLHISIIILQIRRNIQRGISDILGQFP